MYRDIFMRIFLVLYMITIIGGLFEFLFLISNKYVVFSWLKNGRPRKVNANGQRFYTNLTHTSSTSY